MWYRIIIVLLCFYLMTSLGLSNNNNTITQRHNQGTKYTAEELLTRRFPRKISQDVDLDPCKAGKYKHNTN